MMPEKSTHIFRVLEKINSDFDLNLTKTSIIDKIFNFWLTKVSSYKFLTKITILDQISISKTSYGIEDIQYNFQTILWCPIKSNIWILPGRDSRRESKILTQKKFNNFVFF